MRYVYVRKETWDELKRNIFREAPLTHEIAFVAYGLPLPHKDPADRFPAATAKLLGLVLVTHDPEFLGLRDIQTLANR